MNIGDRVRVLHGKEEGIIRKVSPGGRIEVEIEDGFVIPVLKSEVVLVAEAEKNYFGESSSTLLPLIRHCPFLPRKTKACTLHSFRSMTKASAST